MSAVWRRESLRLLAALVRTTHDLQLAEDLAQDALVAALEQWGSGGIPHNPGAWLMTVAKRRAVDHFRRAETLRRRTVELGERLATAQPQDPADTVEHLDDDVLRLMFLTCHPTLSPESRTALTLRMVGGLTTAEIARAFFAKESAVAQRISRAKRALAPADFGAPSGLARQERLCDVMAVVYLIFNEGYAATAGPDWMRPDLCSEALRLARLLSSLAPGEAEVHGLQALLEFQASRTRARIDPDGQPVLLEEQDRTRWDGLLIRRGFEALDRAERLGQPAGPYVLQAALAACHARAHRSADTDWSRIAELYDVLSAVAPSQVVQVNRAVAHGRAYGPPVGLRILEELGDDALPGSPLELSVRGDLLERAGMRDEAAAAFREAARRSRNDAERGVLTRRADAHRPG